MPVLSGSGVEPAAERSSEFEVSIGVTCFKYCSPFSPCKGAWLGLDRPVEDGGSSVIKDNRYNEDTPGQD